MLAIGKAKNMALRHRMKRGFSETIDSYFASQPHTSTRLILDSTGPSATKHYLFLQALGSQRLLEMPEIHAFSGGIFACLGFLAVHQGALRQSIEAFYPDFDREFRACHHSHTLSPLQALHRLGIKKQSAFDRDALERVIQHIFSARFLALPLSDVHPGLIPYVGVQGQKQVMDLRILRGATLTVRECLLSACQVPFFYGPPSAEAPYYDAAFSPGYRHRLRELRAQKQALLISTPWKEGRTGHMLAVNCFGHNYQKIAMFRDFACLLLNVPNRAYQYDLESAFGHD